MSTFKTEEHIICDKCMLKITENYNGWNFHYNEKPLNTYEAYELWNKFNDNDISFFKKYVNSLLINPNAMKY